MNAHYLAMGLGLLATFGAVMPWQLSQKAEAVELADGTTAFLRPPQFLDAFTTNDHAMRRNATYFFTLDLPEDADAPLQSMIIAPQNLTHYLQPYRIDETVAFASAANGAKNELELGDVVVDDDTQAVTVEFSPPVSPGQQVTVGLRPQRNPRLGAIYVFRVTAVPEGDQPQSHIAGHGRLSFTRNDRDRIYP
ncbi:MAG: DUF2808 domain-containing protein [Cyanobacteria bacterium P01_D01_bin.156]